MDLITPGTGLVIWQLVVLVLSLALPIYCLLNLYRSRALEGRKSLWALIIIFIPFFGSVSYLVFTKNGKRPS